MITGDPGPQDVFFPWPPLALIYRVGFPSPSLHCLCCCFCTHSITCYYLLQKLKFLSYNDYLNRVKPYISLTLLWIMPSVSSVSKQQFMSSRGKVQHCSSATAYKFLLLGYSVCTCRTLLQGNCSPLESRASMRCPGEGAMAEPFYI